MVVYELPKLLFKFWMIFDNKYLWGIYKKASGLSYAVVERQRFLLRQQVGIDNREIHERQRRGLRISNLISSCLVFVYFVSFAVVKTCKEYR